MTFEPLTSSNQPQAIEDECIDWDVTSPELNTYFIEIAPQQEGIISEFYEMPGKEYL